LLPAAICKAQVAVEFLGLSAIEHASAAVRAATGYGPACSVATPLHPAALQPLYLCPANMNTTPHILVIGIGNSLRGDDAVGHWLADKIAADAHPFVTVQTMHQLHIEVLEQLQQYTHVMVIDAAIQNEPVLLTAIDAQDTPAHTESHQADVVTLMQLHRNLYQQPIDWNTLRIAAQQFDMGTPLSTACMQHAQMAYSLWQQWLQQLMNESSL
jgi:hydrogenase maturation protease